MSVAFYQLLFVIALLDKLKSKPTIKDHVDLITLESIATRLGIDLNSLEAGFTLNTPLTGLLYIKKELLSEIGELMGDIKGGVTYVPNYWSETIDNFIKDHGPYYAQYVVDGKIDLPVMYNRLLASAKSCRGGCPVYLMESGPLAELKQIANTDYQHLVSVLESDLNADFNKASGCLISVMIIYAIFEFLNSNDLLELDLSTDPDELASQQFITEITALNTLIEMLDNYDGQEPGETEIKAYEILVNGDYFSHLVELEKINPKVLSSLRQMYSLNITGNEDFKSSVKKMADTAKEWLLKALNALKARFEERRKEGSKEAEAIKTAIDKSIEALRGKDGEIDKKDLESLQRQLEKAGFKDHASKLSSINTQSELASVLGTMSAKLTDDIKTLKEAEAKLREAEALVQTASKEPAGVQENTTPEQQAGIKKQLSEAKTNATKAISEASKSIGQSLKSMAVLRSIRGVLERLSKDKPEEVTGNESWKY